MLQYSLIQHDDDRYLTVYIPGHPPLGADSSHPNFDKLVEGALANDESIADLFDVSAAAARKFDRISERVTIANRNVFFDGDLVDNSLTTQIVRFLEEGVNDWAPLVTFMEKVAANPQPHSRDQLYDWLNAHNFTITSEGDIVGYKGVTTASHTCSPESGKPYRSTSSGKAIVNDVPYTGWIPQDVGDTVEMPRTAVAFDPGAACSTGLHVGTHGYASEYGDTLLEVHVNPRDVVSVPTDAGGNKVRVCRYTVVGVLDPEEGAYGEALLAQYGYCPDHGEYEDKCGGCVEEAENLIKEAGLFDEYIDQIEAPEAPIVESDPYPTVDEFDTMIKRAKRRKRNFEKYATKHGPWKLIGDYVLDRHSWTTDANA